MRWMIGIVPLTPLALAACGSAGAAADGIDGSRTFAVGAFDGVRASGADSVHIVRGPVVSVVASGPAKVLDRLDIAVQGTTLNVARKPGGWFDWSPRGATITVTAPSLSAVELAGSGNVDVDQADGPEFQGKVEGSGRLKLAKSSAASLKLSIDGSGGIAARGTAQAASLAVSGSGSIDAKGLDAQTVAITLDGSGGADAVAHRSAALTVAGSGSATVRGTDTCTINKSGSGDARCFK